MREVLRDCCRLEELIVDDVFGFGSSGVRTLVPEMCNRMSPPDPNDGISACRSPCLA